MGGIVSAIMIGAFAGLMPGRSSVSDAAYGGIANGVTERPAENPYSRVRPGVLTRG